MVITFCGHSQAVFTEEEKQRVYDIIESEIIKYPDCVFYLGAYSDSDTLFKITIDLLKAKYKNIKTVFVTPYLDDNYTKLKFAKDFYDDVIYPPLENVPKRYAIIKRNQWMVDNSDLLIAYVKLSFGGASKTLEYAKRKGKPYINVAKRA